MYFQLGPTVAGGDTLGGLNDIFGMSASNSYVPPQEVSYPYIILCSLNM